MNEERNLERVPIPAADPGGPSWLAVGICAAVQIWPVAAILFFLRVRKSLNNRRLEKYRRVLSCVGEREAVPLKTLAQELNQSPNDLLHVLEEMIGKGYLGGAAYVDYSRHSLYLNREAAAEEAREQERTRARRAETINRALNLDIDFDDLADAAGDIANAAGSIVRGIREGFRARPAGTYRAPQTEKRAEPEQAAPEPPKEEAHRADTIGLSAEHAATLEQLERLNVEILDEEVSRKIDRISALTRDIYAFVEQNPDREANVRRFMNYYLPTTMKLLSSYGMLEKQSYQGENIRASRKNIEDILDTLVQAFEKQLDQLFAAEAVDISSDIQVLETMIAKDGLTRQAMQLHL